MCFGIVFSHLMYKRHEKDLQWFCTEAKLLLKSTLRRVPYANPDWHTSVVVKQNWFYGESQLLINVFMSPLQFFMVPQKMDLSCYRPQI